MVVELNDVQQIDPKISTLLTETIYIGIWHIALHFTMSY